MIRDRIGLVLSFLLTVSFLAGAYAEYGIVSIGVFILCTAGFYGFIKYLTWRDEL